MDTFRILSPADLAPAVDVMARAFYRDPLWVYLLPDDLRRAALMRACYRVFLTLSIDGGAACGAGEPLAGLAVWEAPGQPGLRPTRRLLWPLLALAFSPFVWSVGRAGPVFQQFGELRRRYATAPHYYLSTVAVAPDAQGRGLATRLIAPFLRRADREGTAVYTETMTPSNVGLYEHYGFRCMEHYRVPDTNLSIWSFYRQ
ncbi:MAG TPA: GNAT family N-acetyltransferase [Roseiflexaceae bacterium]|nr:GNAT family N-acetyltransferase [Roseiflexaceae bacterium]